MCDIGDRGNVRLVFESQSASYEPIYLYTHWGGYRLLQTVADALERGCERWGDDSYLARIIFSEMVKDDIDGCTGYGLSPYIPDNEYPLVEVNLTQNTVHQVMPPTGYYSQPEDSFQIPNPLSFPDFIELVRALPKPC